MRDAAAVLLLALGALLLHRDGLFGGPAFYERDTQLFYFPLARWVAEQLQAGVYPLWLPGIFTGYPIYADGELGLLYLPQVLLLRLLPTPEAMVWLRALHAFLAGLFTYAYLRTLRLDRVPSLGGALVFAFGSFLSAQMHHENVVRSSVWLPLVLTCLERGLRPLPTRRRLAWFGLAGLAFAQSAVGLHVQPVLMLALATAAYVVFRALTTTQVDLRGRLWPLLGGAGIVLGGLGLAAAQWLPLAEWALVSSRRAGVDYEFASAFGLAAENLPTLIFPFFFRLPDATTWWTLWQQWETELYVGIPTLALALVGIVFSRRVELVYFVPLGVVSLLIGMAHYAPVVNLHRVLWSLPGFSFLRAPARFSYLIVFACACLASFGLQALTDCRRRDPGRRGLAAVGALPSAALLAGLLVAFPAWRSWLTADPVRARAFIESSYLATRAQYPLDPARVLAGLEASLDLANAKTAWSLVLLAISVVGFGVWLALGPSRARLGQGLFVGLVALDLLVFAYDFHPRARLSSLVPPTVAGLPPGERVLLHGIDPPSALEPNQLLGLDLDSVEGYSSLPSQRHVELYDETEVQPALFDIWSARYVVEPTSPVDLNQASGVPFRTEHPLAAGFGGAQPSTFEVPPDAGPVEALRLIGTLSYAFDVPQGTSVATLVVQDERGTTTMFPIRAGIELAERAYDRPSLQGLLRHDRAQVAISFEETTPEGEVYPAHLYEAQLSLPAAVRVRTLTLTPTDAKVLVQVHGIGLISQEAVYALGLANRVGLRQVSPGVLEDTQSAPRAYLLPRDQAFSPARHPRLTPVQLVTSPDFRPWNVLIEGDPSLPPEPDPGAVDPPRPADIVDLGPNALRVTATADRPSFLIIDDFYHRGWTAHVDGQPVRVLIANALFRAVPLDPGQHVVELRFVPLSHQVGAAMSIAGLVGLAALLLWGFRTPASGTLRE